MELKIPIYTILAVVLGILLTSVVPASFTPEQEHQLMTGSDSEVPVMKAPVEEELLDSRADEEMNGAAPAGSVRTYLLNQVLQYSILVVDLLVALGVYLLAKRRFV